MLLDKVSNKIIIIYGINLINFFHLINFFREYRNITQSDKIFGFKCQPINPPIFKYTQTALTLRIVPNVYVVIQVLLN